MQISLKSYQVLLYFCIHQVLAFHYLHYILAFNELEEQVLSLKKNMIDKSQDLVNQAFH